MSSTAPPVAPSPVRARLDSNRLGPLAIASFVLSAAAPVTVVAGVIPTGFATTGILGLSAAFLTVGVVLAFFSVGFSAMSRRISNAGAFYAYIAQGLGRPPGVAAALVAALAYNLLQVGLYGVFGTAASALLNPLLGVDVAWWGWALLAWVVVAALGFCRVDFNAHLLAVLMGLEILLVLILDAANLLNPADGALTYTAFAPSALFVPGAGALFVIAITGFVGFENSAIYSEEARDPARTIPRAIFLCLIVIAVLYSLSAWAMTMGTGPGQIVTVTARDGGETVFNLAGTNLGPAWPTIGHMLLVTSVFAALVAYHNAVGRYVFSLGRERVLPALFATTTRSGAPRWGSIVQSAIGLVAIAVYAIRDLDPMVQLFYWGGTTGGYGVLLLLTVTSAAFIRYHLRHRSGTTWNGLVAPAIALAALLVVTVTATLNFATLLGVPEGSPLATVLPALYLITTAIGLVWAFTLRTANPVIYNTIGLGANSVTGRTGGIEDTTGAHELRDHR